MSKKHSKETRPSPSDIAIWLFYSTVLFLFWLVLFFKSAFSRLPVFGWDIPTASLILSNYYILALALTVVCFFAGWFLPKKLQVISASVFSVVVIGLLVLLPIVQLGAPGHIVKDILQDVLPIPWLPVWLAVIAIWLRVYQVHQQPGKK